MPKLALALGYRSALFVPLLREGEAIGCLTILRAATGEFGAKDISLARTFADQAVIAMENVRLFRDAQDPPGGKRTQPGRGGKRGEELVPRDHEPRDPYADERGDRHERPAAGHASSTPSSTTMPRPSATPAMRS